MATLYVKNSIPLISKLAMLLMQFIDLKVKYILEQCDNVQMYIYIMKPSWHFSVKTLHLNLIYCHIHFHNWFNTDGCPWVHVYLGYVYEFSVQIYPRYW
jgi:hypothetical protein